MSIRRIILILGYSGLIPFIVPALLIASQSDLSDLAFDFVGIYAFGIICFLTGSWWGMASREDSRTLIILSNIYFLAAFLIFFLVPSWWPFAASILLVGIVMLEQFHFPIPSSPYYYRKMRAALTLASSGSMLIIHFAR